jgi:hypothetical protein
LDEAQLDVLFVQRQLDLRRRIDSSFLLPGGCCCLM